MLKKVFVSEIQSEVIIARRKGTRSLKISIGGSNTIRLSVPYLLPEKMAIKFLLTKKGWILEHKKSSQSLVNGDHIGKSHRIEILSAQIDKPKSRLKKNVIQITLPRNVDIESGEAQSFIAKISEKALKKEADSLLPQRLKYISDKYAITYKSINCKKLKSRWGSCDNSKNIILNIYLMQLDWHLIDYVIHHELTHTIHHNHQPAFWESLGSRLPDYKNLRKALKAHPTTVFVTKF